MKESDFLIHSSTAARLFSLPSPFHYLLMRFDKSNKLYCSFLQPLLADNKKEAYKERKIPGIVKESDFLPHFSTVPCLFSLPSPFHYLLMRFNKSNNLFCFFFQPLSADNKKEMAYKKRTKKQAL